MEKQYAQALFQLARKEGAQADLLVEQLMRHLEESGRKKLLPRILRELQRLDAQHKTLGDVFEVASSAEVEEAINEARKLGVTAKPVLNDLLISGWRARIGSRVIDRSGKQALVQLYRTITAHA
jgi:F0F1-type ATP synthase delta subunit